MPGVQVQLSRVVEGEVVAKARDLAHLAGLRRDTLDGADARQHQGTGRDCVDQISD